MQLRQQSILAISILIIIVHFFFAGYTRYQHQPFHDQIEVHVAPDYTHEEVIKPASGLSAFFNLIQPGSNVNQSLHVEAFSAGHRGRPLTLSHREIPIFLSHRVFRI